MKKNIIMVIIILICSMSLLLVLYYFNSKNIYYISDKIIDNNEITMQIKIGSTYTSLETLNDLDSSKYYRISSETNCSSGTANFYYSNSTNKLKLKVTSNPLKCKIVFEEIREDINIVAIFVNGVEQNDAPTNGWYNITYNCKNSDGTTSNAIITWNNETHKLTTLNITKQTYCTVNFTSTNTIFYGYTGDVQTFTVPQTGRYTIELWGASGGAEAGFGGYTKGTISLTSGTIFYVEVGEYGNKGASVDSVCKGGYNGGGNPLRSIVKSYQTDINKFICGKGGGGATDIRTVHNNYSYVGLVSRIMVAAGGGGNPNNYTYKSYAGGLVGYDGYWSNQSPNNAYQGKGGTQISGGALPSIADTSARLPSVGMFGIGGDGGSNNYNKTGGGSGGGGGWYGGSGSSGLSTGVFNGGGGSSYISGHRGCIAVTSTGSIVNASNGYACDTAEGFYNSTTGHSETYACSLSPTGYVFSATEMIDGMGKSWVVASNGTLTISDTLMPSPYGGNYEAGKGHSGNGYARITYLGS